MEVSLRVHNYQNSHFFFVTLPYSKSRLREENMPQVACSLCVHEKRIHFASFLCVWTLYGVRKGGKLVPLRTEHTALVYPKELSPIPFLEVFFLAILQFSGLSPAMVCIVASFSFLIKETETKKKCDFFFRFTFHAMFSFCLRGCSQILDRKKKKKAIFPVFRFVKVQSLDLVRRGLHCAVDIVPRCS